MPSTTPPPLPLHGTWRTYTVADGLASLKVEHIAEDQDGYLWFATLSGISRFDGDEFRTFTQHDGLLDNRVHFALCDRQGRLWCGTDKGVCWYDGRTWHHLEAEGLSLDRYITFMYEDAQSRIWLGGRNVAGYIEGNAYRDLSPDLAHLYKPDHRECWGIAQDRRGRIWLGVRDLIVCYEGERFIHLGPDDGLPNTTKIRESLALAVDEEGVLWVGGGANLWRYVGDTFESVPLPLQDDFASVRKIQTDRQGRLWCATQNGVFWYDGQTPHPLGIEDGLPHHIISAVHQDREGQLWVATWGGGVACYDMEAQRTFGRKAGLADGGPSNLVEDQNGHLWMTFASLFGQVHPSAEKTVASYDGEDFTFYGENQWLHICNVSSLCQDGAGYLWFGGGASAPDKEVRLTCCDPQSMQEVVHEHFPLQGQMVTAIARNRQGHPVFVHFKKDPRVYDSADNSLQISLYDGHVLQELFEVEMDQEITAVTAINTLVEDGSGGVFFALNRGSEQGEGQGGGIGHWHPDRGVRRYTTADGLVHDRPTDLALDAQGQLWIATLGGISCFDGSTFQNFTLADGLPSERVYCVGIDRRGRLWFGTEGGVVHSDGVVFQSMHAPHFEPIFSLLEDRQDQLWFGTQNSLVRYRRGTVPPRVRLLQVVADQVYEEVTDLEITAPVRQITFEFNGISFRTRPRDLLYTWRLDGVDEGEFRQDLYYRLRTFVVDLPPLRQRQADISLLAHYFLERFAAHLNRPLPVISAAAQAQLNAYAWPGNVRELEHLMQRAALICREDCIEVEDLGLQQIRGEAAGGEGLFLPLAELEKRHIERALEATDGVIFGEQGAAALLEINPQTLRSRIRKHGIRRPE